MVIPGIPVFPVEEIPSSFCFVVCFVVCLSAVYRSLLTKMMPSCDAKQEERGLFDARLMFHHILSLVLVVSHQRQEKERLRRIFATGELLNGPETVSSRSVGQGIKLCNQETMCPLTQQVKGRHRDSSAKKDNHFTTTTLMIQE